MASTTSVLPVVQYVDCCTEERSTPRRGARAPPVPLTRAASEGSGRESGPSRGRRRGGVVVAAAVGGRLDREQL